MNALFVNWEQGWLAIGWTMVHFLWLGTAVALCGGAIRLASRRASATVRYTISLTTLALLAALPIAITAWLSTNNSITNTTTPQPLAHTEPTPVSVRPQAELPPTPTPLAPPLTPHISQPKTLPPSPNLETLINTLPWLWLIGAPLTFVLLVTGLIGAERLRRRSQPVELASITKTCEMLCKALRIGRKVSIAVCDSLSQPVLIGIVRPLILLPPAALTGWSPEQLEMVLLHELAHVRRWDNLANFVQRTVESLLFFHPVVWIVSRQVRLDREECCDATVVAHTAKPQAYAELLVDIAASPSPLAGLAMARHPLAGRIRRILKLEDEPMLVSRRMFVLVGIALAALLAVAFWQPVKSSVAEESDVAKVEQKNDATENQESAASRAVPAPGVPHNHTNHNPTDRVAPVPHTVWEEIVLPDGQRYRRPRTIASASSPKPHEALLQPGDQIHIDTLDVFPDHPITGEHVIESTGTLALGAAYGRVKVAGKTLLDAEAAALAHLKTITKDPKVQLTILSQRRPIYPPILTPTSSFGAPQSLPRTRLFPSQPVPSVDAPTSSNTPTWPQTPVVQWSGEPQNPRFRVQPTVPVVQPSSRTALTPSPAPAVSSSYSSGPPSGILLYDGRTFGRWRSLWKNELKTEKRTECIEALAAFGRAGKGEEAAEAIMEVAKQYDFGSGGNKSVRNLKSAIIKALAGDDSIPERHWLALFAQRLKDDPQQWGALANGLLEKVRDDHPDVLATLKSIAKDSEYDSYKRGSAIIALARLTITREDKEAIAMVREALSGKDGPLTMRVFGSLGFRYYGKCPEMLGLVFHADDQIRNFALRHLLSSGRFPNSLEMLSSLIFTLDDPQRTGDHAHAIRAIHAMSSVFDLSNPKDRKKKAAVIARLEKILIEGESALLQETLATLADLMEASDGNYVLYKIQEKAKITEQRKKELVEALGQAGQIRLPSGSGSGSF